MRSGDHDHGPVLLVDVVDGQPARDGQGRFQAPVGHVLVPGDELDTIGIGTFAEEVSGEQEDVLTHDAGHEIDDATVGRHLLDELLVDMPTLQSYLTVLLSLFGLEGVEALSPDLVLVEQVHTGDVSVFLVTLTDLVGFCHLSPVCATPVELARPRPVR